MPNQNRPTLNSIDNTSANELTSANNLGVILKSSEFITLEIPSSRDNGKQKIGW